MPQLPDLARIAGEGIRAAHRRITTREKLERRQVRLASRHIPWVIQHSPWTAQRFAEAGLDPADWWRLPAVGKSEMMANFDALNTVGVRLDDVLTLARQAESTRDFTAELDAPGGPVGVGLSTGTSGTRGAFVVSREDRLRWAGLILASLFRPFPWALRTPQRVAFFLRADGSLYRTAGSSRVHIDFFDILTPVDALAEQLSAARPTLIVGPPSVLLEVWRSGGRARPAQVVSAAEVLEDGAKRELEAGFAAPVVQIYQATEGLLGLPCAHGHLHLNEDHVHIETEEVGGGLVRPVITDLRRRAQPMIRHRLDDLLELAPACSCGSASRRIERIIGRQDDVLRLPGDDGEVLVWPDFLRAALSAVPGLEEYRVTQTGPAVLEIETRPADRRIAEQMRELVTGELGRHGVLCDSITIEHRAWTPPPPGAKLRRVSRKG